MRRKTMHSDHRAVPRIKFLFSALVLIVAMTGYPRHEAYAAESEPGWYIGLGFGKFREGTGALIEESGKSSGRQFFAGYDIYGFLSMEVGFIDLDGPVDELGLVDTRQTYDITGPFARGNLSIPLYSDAQTRVSVFGSAGAMRWDSESKIEQTGGATLTARARDITPLVGGGIWIRTKNASTRLEYFRFKDIEDPFVSGSELELRWVTLSIIYHY
jgi:hypothetical protein